MQKLMRQMAPETRQCAKCHGLCITEKHIDYFEDTVGGVYQCYRCLLCGWQSDDLMEQHRALQRSGKPLPEETDITTSRYEPAMEA